jgi:anti-sigma factor RsiW
MFGWTRKPRDTEPPLTEADRRDLRLSAYLDGDLSAAEREALETSLGADAQLSDAL